MLRERACGLNLCCGCSGVAAAGFNALTRWRGRVAALHVHRAGKHDLDASGSIDETEFGKMTAGLLGEPPRVPLHIPSSARPRTHVRALTRRPRSIGLWNTPSNTEWHLCASEQAAKGSWAGGGS